MEYNYNLIEDVTSRLYELESSVIDVCEYLVNTRQALVGSDKTKIRRLSSNLEKIQISLTEAINDFEQSFSIQNGGMS